MLINSYVFAQTGGVPDPPFANVVLLAHMEGADNATIFTDSSSFARALTANGNAKTEDTQKKFGATSFFGVADSSVTAANSTDFNFGSGDFTIEAWVWASAVMIDNNLPGTVIGKEAFIGETPFWLHIDTTRHLAGTGVSVLGANYDMVDSVDFPKDQWVHITLSREGNDFRLFKNGIQVSTTVTDSAALATNTAAFAIGGRAAANERWYGYIDDVRVTKGTAVYTANFSPPTVTFPDS